MDQIVIPDFRKRVQEAFAAADALGIAPKKQPNLFGKKINLIENLPAMKEKIVSEANEETARRAGYVIEVAESVAALYNKKADLKRFLRKPFHQFGGRKLIDIMTSDSTDDLSELAGFLEGLRN